MFVANKWKEYRLLDTADGERLEQWGDYTLVRPDPQVIWHGEKQHKGWKNANGVYRRSRSGGGDWIKKEVYFAPSKNMLSREYKLLLNSRIFEERTRL